MTTLGFVLWFLMGFFVTGVLILGIYVWRLRRYRFRQYLDHAERAIEQCRASQELADACLAGWKDALFGWAITLAVAIALWILAYYLERKLRRLS